MSYGGFERRNRHRLDRLFAQAKRPDAATQAVCTVCQVLAASGVRVLSAHSVNGRGRVVVNGPLNLAGGIKRMDRWDVVWACPVHLADLPPVQVEWTERRLPLGRRHG